MRTVCFAGVALAVVYLWANFANRRASRRCARVESRRRAELTSLVNEPYCDYNHYCEVVLFLTLYG
jgi:hypothetical protein